MTQFVRALFLLLFLILSSTAVCQDMSVSFFKDMLIVKYWNDRINDRLPVTYNHWLQGGYINMPSARMGKEGEIGFGFASVPPYRTYNLRCQLIDRLEITGNYRIFKGVDDPILTPLGFGDLSDKGANIKLSLFCAEDSDYTIPGLAIGTDDFMGTRNFKAWYVVATQVFINYDCEATLGYGTDRIRGFFGGFSWMPFRRMPYSYLKGISLLAEYDAVPYKDQSIEKHPKGRKKKSPINLGVKYRLWDALDFSASYIRGREWAFSVSSYYNFGETRGFLPKIDDPLPYQAPTNTEPLGCRRPEDVMVQDLLYAMRRQGFDLLEARISSDECGEKLLRLHVVNLIYTNEPDVRTHLNHLLSALIPSDIDKVTVVIEIEGFPIQEYHYTMEYVRLFGAKEICAPELRILTPLCEVSKYGPYTSRRIFKKNRDLWNLEIYPKTHTFFGSAKGKFKYTLGLSIGLNGFLYTDVYYSLVFGYNAFSDLENVTGVDRLNPSQLPNVRTDIVRYYNQPGITVDEMYLQKNWNLGKGFFSRVAVGLFEEEYGGVASEVLYYPVNANWAIGVEGALLRKRTIKGIGFTDRIRQLDGFVPHHHKFRGSQYFLDLYYDWTETQLDFKIMIGKFLANDKGARFEVSRYFPSGLRVTVWYTYTNGHDKINGQTYYDKGIGISMPLDIFYTYSDMSRWGYGMSAWLRDVGVIAETGMKLYEMIREQRNN